MEQTVSGGTPARVPSRVRETLAATISAAQNAAMNAQADGGALPGMREAFDRADALLREWGVEVAPPGDPVQEIAASFASAAASRRWCECPTLGTIIATNAVDPPICTACGGLVYVSAPTGLNSHLYRSREG